MVLFMSVLDGLSFVMRNNFPKYLKFELHYLGGTPPSWRSDNIGTEETYTLNFSRPGNQVIAQYFSFIRLGFKGYQSIMRQDLTNARILSDALEKTGCILLCSPQLISDYTCVSTIHHQLSDCILNVVGKRRSRTIRCRSSSREFPSH